MSNYVNDLNELITAKSEIKNIIQDTLNENPSEVFSYYPSYIARIAASSEGPYVVSYSYLSENYPDFTYLYAYVADAVESGGGSVDLSSYVTYSYAYETYPTYSYADNKYFGRLAATISDGNVISSIGESFDAGASVRGIYFQMTYVPSYAYIESYYTTKSELSSAGYLTSSDLPVIDENIIPKETGTYTLGDSSHLYDATYTNNIFMDGHSITYRSSTSMLFSISNRDSFIMLNSSFCPSHNGMNLGIDYPSNKWLSTYTTNIYADNAYTSNIYLSEKNAWVNTSNWQTKFKIDGSDKYMLTSNRFYPYNTGAAHLGSSGNKWGDTYTENLRADTAYLNNSTYLPVNTYWYDGSTYHWLGDLFN